MRDNLEGLTDIFNMELKNIKVSEQLKLKTLEKCISNKKNSIHKGILPITCTIAACLLVGVIIYPIYNKNNTLNNESITMDTRKKDIKTLEEQQHPYIDEPFVDEPYMDTIINKERANIKQDEKNKIIKSEVVEENQNEISKNSKEQKQEKEIIVLNDKPTMPFKVESSIKSEKKDKDISYENKDIIVATTDIIDKEKLKNDNRNDENKNNSTSSGKGSDLITNEEPKMKTLSMQEATNFFESNIKNPYYIPKDFFMEKILVPEVDSNSNELYEIIYSNNSQFVKITEYKNVNYSGGFLQNSSLESKISEENNMININNILVKYIIYESIDNKDLPYVEFTWENLGKKYTAEGNAPWAEVINIVSSITK